MTLRTTLIITVAAVALAALAAQAATSTTALVDHQLSAIDGSKLDLGAYRGKVLLIVNTASECGYTRQYTGLQRLYTRYRERGLVVIGVPSNDFGGQEPAPEKEIKTFCESRFGVTFPLTAKTVVSGDGKAPLYRTLTEQTPEGIRGEIQWNFTKFLVDREGRVVARFEPKVEPLADEVIKQIEALLPAQP